METLKEGHVTLSEIERLKSYHHAINSDFVNQNLIMWLEIHIIYSIDQLSKINFDFLSSNLSSSKIKKSD